MYKDIFYLNINVIVDSKISRDLYLFTFQITYILQFFLIFSIIPPDALISLEN